MVAPTSECSSSRQAGRLADRCSTISSFGFVANLVPFHPHRKRGGYIHKVASRGLTGKLRAGKYLVSLSQTDLDKMGILCVGDQKAVMDELSGLRRAAVRVLRDEIIWTVPPPPAAPPG